MARRRRTYARATDQLFLDRIAAGTLRVDGRTAKAKVYVRRTPRCKWKQLRPFWGGKEHAPYLFVRAHLDGARKAIALHRLVWIAANGRLVPAGFDVDHADTDRLNNAADNLRLRDSYENRSAGAYHSNGQASPWDEEF